MRFKTSLSIMALAVTLGGCAMTTPSQVNVDRIQVTESKQSFAVDRHDMSDAMLSQIAGDYKRSSEGVLSMHVSYPYDVRGAEAHAKRDARRYSDELKSRGVHDIKVETVAMKDMSYDNRVVVSYKGFQAEAPKDCGRIVGAFGAETVYDIGNYKMGCEHMRYMSKMINDPRDLLGRGTVKQGDSRRSGNVVERYKTGEEFEKLDTNAASEIGG